MIKGAVLGPHELSFPQITLIVVVGLLAIATVVLTIQTYFSSNRAATAFEEAGYATTNLSNIQREALLLRIQTHAFFSDFSKLFEPIEDASRDYMPVELRRKFLSAQLKVATARASGNASALAELEQIGSTLSEYDTLLAFVRANPTSDQSDAIAQSDEILIQLARQVKALYDREEVQFFKATSASLDTQRSSQILLIVVSGIMLALSLVLAVSLRQSVGTAFKRAYNSLETEILDRKQAEQETWILAEVGRIVGSSLDIEMVYRRFTDQVQELIPFDRLSVMTLDEDKETVTITYSTGLSTTEIVTGNTLPMRSSLTFDVVRSRSGRLLQATTEEELSVQYTWLLPAFHAGLRSWLAVPLVSRNEVVGALVFSSKRPEAYTGRDMVLADRIANQISGAIGNSQLYADLRQAESALRSSEEQTRLIVETARDAFISMDSHGLIRAWNDQAVITFGWPRTEAIGRPLASLVLPTRYRERHQQGLEHFLNTGEGPVLNQRIELEALHRDGHEFPVELTISPLKSGETFIFNAFIHDITERREAEEQTRASLEEKEVLLKEINHRVKNNLQIISSLLNLQSRDIQDEQALRSFQVSQDRIRAMAMVHEKLYQSDDLARVDFGEYIDSLATDLCSSYGLGSRHIDLKLDVEKILLGVDDLTPKLVSLASRVQP